MKAMGNPQATKANHLMTESVRVRVIEETSHGSGFDRCKKYTGRY